jgi:hypothetical protein
MVAVHPQYVVDENQHPQGVLLSVAEWEQVVEELEELDDIRAYDEAKASPQETVAFEQAELIQASRGPSHENDVLHAGVPTVRRLRNQGKD